MALSKQQRSGSLLNLFLKALLHHYNHEKRFVWKLICCKNKNNCSLNFTDVFFCFFLCFLFLFGQKCKLYLLYLAQFQFTSLNFEKKKKWHCQETISTTPFFIKSPSHIQLSSLNNKNPFSAFMPQ